MGSPERDQLKHTGRDGVRKMFQGAGKNEVRVGTREDTARLVLPGELSLFLFSLSISYILEKQAHRKCAVQHIFHTQHTMPSDQEAEGSLLVPTSSKITPAGFLCGVLHCPSSFLMS